MTDKKLQLAIIHMLPLEKYPPVMNLVKTLELFPSSAVRIISTQNGEKAKSYFTSSFNIKRYASLKAGDNPLMKIIKYLRFNLGSIIHLWKFRPEVILYYESYSALPAYFYLKFINRKAKLWIHFHEYFSKEWYAKGMQTVRFNHKLEQKFLFSKANYITETNDDRIRLFRQDYPQVKESQMKALPNYPVQSWCTEKLRHDKIEFPLKTVYVGAVSLHATYIQEYCEWVVNQKGRVLFDLFTFHLNDETKQFFSNLDSSYIQIHIGQLNYPEIPAEIIKNKYHVGLILYKCTSLNYIYNAPNKLFEYLSCGLDVWYGSDMKGCYPYDNQTSFPKIIRTNFTKLEQINIEERMNRKGLKESEQSYIAEAIYEPMLNDVLRS